jgi:hypothetical protein
VGEKGLTNILSMAKGVLGAHEQFANWKDSANEADLRALVHWPGDEHRLAGLNVFLRDSTSSFLC